MKSSCWEEMSEDTHDDMQKMAQEQTHTEGTAAHEGIPAEAGTTLKGIAVWGNPHWGS